MMNDVAAVSSPPETDRGNLEAVFIDVAPALWRTLTVYVGGRADLAEDIVLEAFTRALEQPKIRNPVGWLYRTAFRLAAAEIRRESHFTYADVDTIVEYSTDVQELLISLGSLSARQRAAVILHYHLGFPVKDIARILEISVPTAKVHLFRARKRLRAMYP